MRQIALDQCHSSVRIEGGKLFFGKNEVKDCSFINEEKKTVAQLYTVRVFDGTYWRLVTTLDLIDGKYWLCGVDIKLSTASFGRESWPSGYYDSIEAIEKILNLFGADTAGKNWAFFEEEDFDAHSFEMEWPEDDD